MAAQVNHELDYQRGALGLSSGGHATSAMNPVHAVAVEVSGLQLYFNSIANLGFMLGTTSQ